MGSVVGRWPQHQIPLIKGCWARARSGIRGHVGHCAAAAAPYVPSRRDVRKSGFATLLAYNLSEASEPLVKTRQPLVQAAVAAAVAARTPLTAIIIGGTAYHKMSLLSSRNQRSFSTSSPAASLGSFFFGKSNEINKNTSNSDSNSNKDTTNNNDSINETASSQPALNKDKPTIKITTPSSGTITLPATSAKIGQTLRRHHAREELLAQSRTFIGRFWIRFKLLFLKQVRPITLDDVSAVFSWFLLGNIIWILLGTTTFFSIVLFTMNTVFAQEYIAQMVGNLITKETGLTVVFENAIVPHWNNGMISFNKVFVSRRPWRGNHRVQKGSQAAAVADAERNDAAGAAAAAVPHDDGNYTQFDLTIDTVSVTLSLSKWMSGSGIVKDVDVHGMRGVVDRTHVYWEPGEDATKYKNVHQTGDFEIENFKMEDVLITLYQPAGFRPFKVSIFNCELPRLRKHWLFYDLLSATNMSGTYDNALFTIHPRQLEDVSSAAFEAANQTPWKKVNRLRCDGVNIDHLNTGIEGPLGWIESGTVDMTADVMLPNDKQNMNLVQVIREIKDSWKESARTFNSGRECNNADENNSRAIRRKGKNAPAATTMSAHDVIVEGKPQGLTSQLEERLFGAPGANSNNSSGTSSYVVLDFRVQLNNCKAAVPLFNKDLTYINNALIRPIVAYINSRDTYIPISCQIVKSFADFEGSWTMYDSRLMDDLSTGVYDAFAANIVDDEARALRMRKVGFWSLQLAAQILLLSLGAIA